ncbi:nucleotidyltransferase family protein, partial [Dinghuibacter sp.]|uniref:nucleotidyltransferase family protein n=1 Tax=Dinghuibacter sp. TaxID=2024697 RepID=UPI0039C88C62
MYTLETILEKLRAFKPELQRKYPISSLGVFGSYARGEATEKSDVDVAVEF